MGLQATYISANEFKVAGDKEDSFTAGRRVNANCDTDGIKYLTVDSSTVNGDGDTEVLVKESELTANLKEVLFGVVATGARGGLPVHDHSNDDQGGEIAAFQGHGEKHTDGTDDVPDFVGADASASGNAGLVPAPAAGDQESVLRGDGMWAKPLQASDMRRYALIYGV